MKHTITITVEASTSKAAQLFLALEAMAIAAVPTKGCVQSSATTTFEDEKKAMANLDDFDHYEAEDVPKASRFLKRDLIKAV